MTKYKRIVSGFPSGLVTLIGVACEPKSDRCSES